MCHNPNALRVAERFTKALMSLDAQAVADLYTDDVKVYQNTTNTTQSKEENIAMLRKIFAVEAEHGYHDIVHLETSEGFIQLHTFKPVLKDGSSAGEARVCMVVKVEGDKIANLCEFLDGAKISALWQRVEEAQ